MTVVVGTAGHIDHGKTALLRALTGIDADRLPEERRRGMTIDVGYAHFGLADGTEIDFVDVPGHDRLIGNMLVGAGEMDAVMLVVAADDGPRAQTIEHLELLDALGIEQGIAVVTKVDVTDADRIAEVREAVTRLLAGTSLARSPVLAASSVSGEGIEEVSVALEALRDRVVAGGPSVRRDPARAGTSRLAVDRTFSVKGRGLVVTGTLRGGPLARNATLRLVPGDAVGRARELQVHGRTVETAGPGRAAINLAGIEPDIVHRGAVLTDDPAVVATDRLLVRLSRPMPDGTRTRVHLGTTSIDGVIGRSGRDAIDLDRGEAAAVVRLSGPVAASPGDRFVLRLGAADRPIGGVVLDTVPPRGISRQRQSRGRIANLAATVDARDDRAIERARLDLHGALAVSGSIALAADVAETAAAGVLTAVAAVAPIEGRHTLAEVRAGAARTLRRLATVRRDDAAVAAEQLVERLINEGRLARDGEHVGLPGTDRRRPGDADQALRVAMDRLATSLAAASPPPLGVAAREAGCPEVGIRELVREGRIVLLDRDLAYEAETYRTLEARALDLARQSPLTPATLRDATSTSRKYVMAILADLDRREILRRTELGHVPGPRAASVVAVRPVAAREEHAGGQ